MVMGLGIDAIFVQHRQIKRTLVSNNLGPYGKERKVIINVRITSQTPTDTLYIKGRNLIWIRQILIQAFFLAFYAIK